MAIVECGLCGWSEEVDEELPLQVIYLKSQRLYTKHMLDSHPTEAHTDAIVHHYLHHELESVD